jgi:SAM-dependent methyltransferase
MLDKKTEESRLNYNKKAFSYESTFEGKFTLPFNKLIYDNIVINDGDSVLDAACGNGRLLNMLLNKARIKAYGIDISEEMIKIASKENGKISFLVSPADETPFEDNKFDLLTVCCAFHHFARPGAFMAEAGRILKSGGRLMIAEPYSPMIIRHLENAILPFFKMGDVRLYSKNELKAFFEKAHFKEITFKLEDSKLLVEGVK